ncbi:class I SAM-dependent methyltransferase [Streptomyces rugosispiralis]|uniref:Class I SAM-dependent methyltransferase n=1 Tax=Streptomyces rugosispiralis TaxID=2967341 RepID=A0ABT1VCU7_9ACTN|nr:class I SAM-dependent methyltransferase [Streptomyces rugosispiralis]MCQ8195215.1 class I SAM-dependent methyltransferase [Streptomyces rugosispiralis]
MGLSMAAAERWVQRWDRQQQRYAIDREERFTVIADVVQQATNGRRRPLVIEFGCGPGSLTARLAGRLPEAEVIAVDMDPLLLELARTRHADAARYVETVIGEAGWIDALGLDGPPHTAVSTTALRYLAEDSLRRTYLQLADLLRPGGVLVNADHFPSDDTQPTQIAAHVGNRRAERLRAFAHEDWESWWAATARDPELAGLLTERRGKQPSAPHGGGGHNGLSLSRHVKLLHQAGCAQVGPVWQFGSSHVLVAVR